MTYQAKVRILGNRKVKADYYLCALDSAAIAKACAPGQFLNIRIGSPSGQPLLRRPFSIHRVTKLQSRKVTGRIEVLYEAVGEGTRILSQKKAGEYLDVIGPLGKGFRLKQQVDSVSRSAGSTGQLVNWPTGQPANWPTGQPANRQTIIVAGGMGVAPLVFLAQELKKRTTPNAQRITPNAKRPTQVLIGAQTASQILCEKEFKSLGCVVKIATDDGSRGFKGRVTDLLSNVLRTTPNAQRPTLYACGPRPMLKEVCRLSLQYHIPAQVSLEEHMACGLGACLGCAVNTQDGYQRVCKEGPVFPADQIVWEGEKGMGNVAKR
jgi:dihydroorotate dehydrogenase electron transfer subunit